MPPKSRFFGDSVALMAPGVVNNGITQARMGQVILASGNAFTIDFVGDQIINFIIETPITQKPIDTNNSIFINNVNLPDGANANSLLFPYSSYLPQNQSNPTTLNAQQNPHNTCGSGVRLPNSCTGLEIEVHTPLSSLNN